MSLPSSADTVAGTECASGSQWECLQITFIPVLLNENVFFKPLQEVPSYGGGLGELLLSQLLFS